MAPPSASTANGPPAEKEAPRAAAPTRTPAPPPAGTPSKARDAADEEFWGRSPWKPSKKTSGDADKEGDAGDFCEPSKKKTSSDANEERGGAAGNEGLAFVDLTVRPTRRDRRFDAQEDENGGITYDVKWVQSTNDGFAELDEPECADCTTALFAGSGWF